MELTSYVSSIFKGEIEFSVTCNEPVALFTRLSIWGLKLAQESSVVLGRGLEFILKGIAYLVKTFCLMMCNPVIEIQKL